MSKEKYLKKQLAGATKYKKLAEDRKKKVEELKTELKLKKGEIGDVKRQMTGSEALFGFFLYLSTLDTKIDLKNPKKLMKLLENFCMANSLPKPRRGYDKLLRIPAPEIKPKLEKKQDVKKTI